MRSRSACTAALALAIGLLGADAAHAQGQLNLSVGLFAVRGEDARVDGDVLVENRELFLFDFNDFNTISFGAEYVAPIGEYLEFGGGVGFNSRTVDTIYDDYVRPDGTEIEQQLKLRIVPFTATVRVLPFGRSAAVQPYVGGGIGLFNWRYSETGDFIDFSVPGEPDLPRELLAERHVDWARRRLWTARAGRQRHVRRRDSLSESRGRSRHARLPRRRKSIWAASTTWRRLGFDSDSATEPQRHRDDLDRGGRAIPQGSARRRFRDANYLCVSESLWPFRR